VEEKRIKKIKYFNTCILKKERKGEKNNAFVECHQLTLVMAALQPFQKLKKEIFPKIISMPVFQLTLTLLE
jgi:hypothetical protein